MPYGHASMLLLGEGSEANEPYNKYDKIRQHSIRSLQFDQKVRPLSFRPKKFDLFTATHLIPLDPSTYIKGVHSHWKYLMNLVFWKLRSTTAVIPKTIATSNNPQLNRNIRSLVFALFNLLKSLNLPILSPKINNDFDPKIFYRDGIHFSFFGNAIFT